MVFLNDAIFCVKVDNHEKNSVLFNSYVCIITEPIEFRSNIAISGLIVNFHGTVAVSRGHFGVGIGSSVV